MRENAPKQLRANYAHTKFSLLSSDLRLVIQTRTHHSEAVLLIALLADFHGSNLLPAEDVTSLCSHRERARHSERRESTMSHAGTEDRDRDLFHPPPVETLKWDWVYSHHRF